jgi:hypothetical protein
MSSKFAWSSVLAPGLVSTALLTFVGAAFGSSTVSLAESVDAFLQSESNRQQEVVEPKLREVIQAAVASHPEFFNDEIVTEERLVKALSAAFLSAFSSPDEDSLAVANIYSSRLPMDLSGETAMGLGLALLPLLIDEGYCSGDLSSEQGLICAFTAGSSDASVVAEIAQPELGAHMPLRAIAESPLITSVFSACSDAGVELKGSSVNGNVTDTVCFNFPYAYAYVFQYKCGGGIFDFGCDAWAEFTAAVNVQYLAGGSDMIMGVLPAAVRCDESCTLKVLYDLARGKDVLAYLLRQEKRYFIMRDGGSFAKHALLPTCNRTVPAAYQARIPYQVVQQGNFRLPYDQSISLKFGTAHQQAGDPLVGAQSSNVFPVPTIANLAQLASSSPYTPLPAWTHVGPLPNWAYKFNAVQAWNFNLMFAGVEATSTSGCSASVLADSLIPGTGGRVTGDQFFAWYGRAGSSIRGLPEVRYLFGFNSAHQPVTCPPLALPPVPNPPNVPVPPITVPPVTVPPVTVPPVTVPTIPNPRPPSPPPVCEPRPGSPCQ